MMNDYMKYLMGANDGKSRVIRTIIQGLIGCVIAYLDVILGFFSMPDEMRPFVAAAVMAILSPIMAAFGDTTVTDSAVEAVRDDIELTDAEVDEIIKAEKDGE